MADQEKNYIKKEKFKMTLNKVILLGNLTKDPESQTTSSGITICKFTLAVQRKFSNANGEKETDFINIVAWRTLAENCIKYLSKGKKVAVVGAIQTRSYDAQDGTKRYVTEIIAEEVEFLSSNGGKQETEKMKKLDESEIGDILPF